MDTLYPSPQQKKYEVRKTFCLEDGYYLNDTLVLCQAYAETQMYRSLNATEVIKNTNRTITGEVL